MNEFRLIERLTSAFPIYHDQVIKAVGDDCSIWLANGKKQVFTTDTMVEGDHFLKAWFSPEEIGARLVETNVSDIAAMGGKPDFLYISLVRDEATADQWLEGLYTGINSRCQAHRMTLMGGNTTHGRTLSLTAGVQGYCPENVICRDQAKAGDLVVVTGQVGGACMARLLKMVGAEVPIDLWRALAAPRARVKEALMIQQYAHAMIDISDGVASEARHLADDSGLGVEIDDATLPVPTVSKECLAVLNTSPAECAYRGGEDYELMFTIAPKDWKRLKKIYESDVPLTVLGSIKNSPGAFRLMDGKRVEMPSGYDHFGQNLVSNA